MTQIVQRLGVTAVLLLALAGAAQGRPLVLELFTSQGCSSCPPVDKFVGTLTGKPDILVLAYHVTYWDSQGWRDHFSLDAATRRQEVYARRLGHPSATPEMVIDGQNDALGPNTDNLRKALGEPHQGIDVALSVADQALRVEVGPRDGPGGAADVLVVPYLRHAVTAVGRGENSGHTLEEFNIVRAIRPVGTWHGAAQSFTVALGDLPKDATDVAVIVQAADQGPVLGASSVALPGAAAAGR